MCPFGYGLIFAAIFLNFLLYSACHSGVEKNELKIGQLGQPKFKQSTLQCNSASVDLC